MESLLEKLPSKPKRVTTTAAECDHTIICTDGFGCGYRHCPARMLQPKNYVKRLKDS